MISEKYLAEKSDNLLETGGFPQSENQNIESGKFVVASYNIRYAVGSFLISGGILRKAGISRPSRRTILVKNNIQKTAKVFTDSKLLPKPDFIALQEADKETKRAGRIHTARALAQEMKLNYAHASLGLPRNIEPIRRQWYLDFEEPILQSDEGETGLAMLTKQKVENIERIELPWNNCPWRPRIAMKAIVIVNGKKILIFNSHIDPHAKITEQNAQHEAILSLAEKENLPTIYLGDFNTLTPKARKLTRQYLEKRGLITPFINGNATWRAGLFTNHTDWIFSRGINCLRHGIAKPLSVSDHYPIWAEFDLSSI